MRLGETRLGEAELYDEKVLAPIRGWCSRNPAPLVSPVEALSDLVSEGNLQHVPLPASGRTLVRFKALALFGSHDLALARLVEGHLDALAILAEAGMRPAKSATFGVFAAGPPSDVTARRLDDSSWVLDGTRRWCSGAADLTAGLVTAADISEEEQGDPGAQGAALFLVDLRAPGVEVDRRSWPAVGMARSATFDITLDGVKVTSGGQVGKPGWYLDRPGFHFGSTGVAAVWLGGAAGIARALESRVEHTPTGHGRAAHGDVTALLWSMSYVLQNAACVIDAGGARNSSRLEIVSLASRLSVERGCTAVLRLVGEATGAGPLGHDAAHSHLVADLTVYLRQHHGRADAEQLSRALSSEREAGSPATAAPRDLW
ncbi:MAG: acyl-CoA dehydrogenase family protein [Acidimicrobiales bacterium]